MGLSYCCANIGVVGIISNDNRVGVFIGDVGPIGCDLNTVGKVGIGRNICSASCARDRDGGRSRVVVSKSIETVGGRTSISGCIFCYKSNFIRGSLNQCTAGKFVSDGISGFAPPVFQRITGNQARLNFTGKPGTTYRFQRSTNLTSWSTIQTLTAGANGQIQFTDSTPPAGKVFYRLATP